MVYKKKSWKEKLKNDKKFPKILEFNPKFPCGKVLKKWEQKLVIWLFLLHLQK